MRVQSFEHAYLPWLLDLVNVHLSVAVPGWALTGEFLAEHLERNHDEYLTDPWVVERETICAVEGYRVLAAAHLLRYGDGPEVSESYRGAGEIGWLLFPPDRTDAASEALSVAKERLSSWPTTRKYGWGGGIPTVPMLGVPDAWPHVAEALSTAGFHTPERHHRETLYGGTLDGVPAPGEPPAPGLSIRRTAGNEGARFAVVLDGEEIGHCEFRLDLTRGGALPALSGWADLWEIEVKEGWRNNGVGGWLLRNAAAWMRLAGCGRVVINVTEDDEAAGAGRFYRRFGWDVFTREVAP